MPAPSRLVDSHQHVNWHHRDAAGLVEDLDRHRIEYAWLLTWLTEPDDAVARPGYLNPVNQRQDGSMQGITLAEIIAARDRFPGRFVVGYCPDPRQPGAPDLLEAAYYMHHARICGEWKFRMLFDDPRCLELFKTAGRLQMPVVLHLDTPYLPDSAGNPVYQEDWYGGTLENLQRALLACSETIFIGHAPAFWREISADAASASQPYPDGPVREPGRLVELFENFPNLRADLSAGSALRALRRDPQHAARFLKRFSDRLLFGRDYYGDQLHQFIQTLDLDKESTENIYWRNAETLVPGPNPVPATPGQIVF